MFRLGSNAVVDKGPYTENGESVGLSVTLEKKDMDGVDDDGEEDCSTEDEGVEEARASSGIRGLQAPGSVGSAQTRLNPC